MSDFADWGHLVAPSLGGPTAPSNLSPGTGSADTRTSEVERRLEAAAGRAPDARTPADPTPRLPRAGVRGGPTPPPELVPASPGYRNSAMIPGPDAAPGGQPLAARQLPSAAPVSSGPRIPYRNESAEQRARLDAEHERRQAAGRPDAAAARVPVSPTPPSPYRNESAEQAAARLAAHERAVRATLADAAPARGGGSGGGYANAPAPRRELPDAAPRPGDVYRTTPSRYPG